MLVISTLATNIVNVIVCGIVLLLLLFAISAIIKDKKKGGCSGGCCGCSMSSMCHSNEDEE
jgi:hypothetical protein